MASFNLRATCFDASVRYGGEARGVFDSAAFAESAKAEFGLAEAPDAAWVARVLGGLDYVARFGPHDVWRLAD